MMMRTPFFFSFRVVCYLYSYTFKYGGKEVCGAAAVKAALKFVSLKP